MLFSMRCFLFACVRFMPQPVTVCLEKQCLGWEGRRAGGQGPWLWSAENWDLAGACSPGASAFLSAKWEGWSGRPLHLWVLWGEPT